MIDWLDVLAAVGAVTWLATLAVYFGMWLGQKKL